MFVPELKVTIRLDFPGYPEKLAATKATDWS
jgi:hypothetical protein